MYVKGVAAREKILDAVLEVVARDGYRGASVRELARAAGISQNGLMHHFSSKDELFTAALSRRDEVQWAEFESSRVRANPMRVYLDSITRHARVPGLLELHTRLSVEAIDPAHPAHAYFARVRVERIAIVQAAIDDGSLDGPYVRTSSARGIDLTLTAVADGLQILYLQDSTIDMAAELERLFASLGLVSE
jgi:AcrR family transcriptional regulator